MAAAVRIWCKRLILSKGEEGSLEGHLITGFSFQSRHELFTEHPTLPLTASELLLPWNLPNPSESQSIKCVKPGKPNKTEWVALHLWSDQEDATTNMWLNLIPEDIIYTDKLSLTLPPHIKMLRLPGLALMGPLVRVCYSTSYPPHKTQIFTSI